ncbi:MAG: polysaccharide pyruvyl transferase family protein [Acidaminococcales bacterium]|nr:polysaccharide pyruvyl transferase family protein [Acidaminococcales bacterium]
MKYGLLIDFGAPHCNFGDYVQSVAIEYLYDLMGIPYNEIVKITQSELATYDGEQLLLPYNYVLHFLVNPKDGGALLSDKITPVFFGASVEFATLFDAFPLSNFTAPGNKWLELFRQTAPIGCRDAFTCDFLNKIGISSYLQGCITNILPRRQSGEYGKVLLIDCPNEVLPHIPDDILSIAEAMSNAEHIGDLTVEENYQKIKRRYDYYRDNAALIVTARYHVATPCNAMGIPTIFVKRPYDKHVKDIRLDTLNPGISLYTGETLDAIDWKPQYCDFNEYKTALMRLAMARIDETRERFTQGAKIRHLFAAGRK